MNSLPPISKLISGSEPPHSVEHLSAALSLLFEASPALSAKLASQLASGASSNRVPHSYGQLVDDAISVIRSWQMDDQADFVRGHPRIGEVKVAISPMSASEQRHSPPTATDPRIIERLAFLNDLFERRYPGLVYITFVNGRSRAEIAEELEQRLTEEGVLPGAERESGLEGVKTIEKHSEVWNAEVARAATDVGKIAKNRLQKLNVE